MALFCNSGNMVHAEARRSGGDMDIDDISGSILDAAIKLHMRMGPGLLETVYEQLLAAALIRAGFQVERQVAIDIVDEGQEFPAAFRIDLLVESCVIVEIKSVERLMPVHQKQVMTYLRLTGLQVGLLINFNNDRPKDGVQRIVNGYKPSASPRLRVNQIKL
jgi:GxxExxY protein